VNELSSYINLKGKTIYCLVNRIDIPHYRIGKLIRFKKEEIDLWLETKSVKPLQKQVDKILADIYTPVKGRPGRLKREVI
jgi:excisionase family DNA binding protein